MLRLGVAAFAAANTPRCPAAMVNGESEVIKVDFQRHFNFPSLKEHSAADVLGDDNSAWLPLRRLPTSRNGPRAVDPRKGKLQASRDAALRDRSLLFHW